MLMGNVVGGVSFSSFPHLYKVEQNKLYSIGLSSELNNIMTVKHIHRLSAQ